MIRMAVKGFDMSLITVVFIHYKYKKFKLNLKINFHQKLKHLDVSCFPNCKFNNWVALSVYFVQ